MLCRCNTPAVCIPDVWRVPLFYSLWFRRRRRARDSLIRPAGPSARSFLNDKCNNYQPGFVLSEFFHYGLQANTHEVPIFSQWAAVNIHLSLISDPPHAHLLLAAVLLYTTSACGYHTRLTRKYDWSGVRSRPFTMCGNSLGSAFSPPTINDWASKQSFILMYSSADDNNTGFLTVV